ncbi:rhomboid family intramembrane serine protease [Planctomycetota bacterium]
MGIHDRDYYRQPPSQSSLRGPQTIVGMLILINVAVYFADGLFFSQTHALMDFLSVKVESLTRPWYWWQFLTYGFVHAPHPGHILGNMLVLFFLGRDVEMLYGRKEFLRLYLALLVAASVVWAVVEMLQQQPPNTSAVGASGAVMGIVVLYALNFPRRTLLLFFVIPMPAWVAGLLVVGFDVWGTLGKGGDQIAYTAHLGGAAFAFLYFRSGWKLSGLTAGWSSPGRRKRRPNLRVHDPDRRARQDQEMKEEVDRILEKISREGEDSLTRRERRTLENASREYQKKRDGPDDDTL